MDDESNKRDDIQAIPNSVSLKKSIKILNQLKYSIFEIKYNEKISTGFFCKIPYEKGLINTLIINYQLYKEQLCDKNNVLNLSLNEDEIKIKINLEPERKKFYSENLDIIIIETKIEDEINNNIIYLDIDNDLLNNNSEIFYKEDSIYVLQYKGENNASVSYGLITQGDKYDKSEIIIYSDISESSI